MDTGSGRHHERATTPVEGFLAKVAMRVQQRLCGLHGHDSLLHFENGRMSLLCTSCGHESPGWDVKTTPSRRHSEPATERVVQLPLVDARRAA